MNAQSESVTSRLARLSLDATPGMRGAGLSDAVFAALRHGLRSGIFQPDTFLFPRAEIILSENEEEVGTYHIDTSNCPDSVYPTNVVRRKDLVCMRQPLWYDVIVAAKPPVLDVIK